MFETPERKIRYDLQVAMNDLVVGQKDLDKLMDRKEQILRGRNLRQLSAEERVQHAAVTKRIRQVDGLMTNLVNRMFVLTRDLGSIEEKEEREAASLSPAFAR